MRAARLQGHYTPSVGPVCSHCSVHATARAYELLSDAAANAQFMKVRSLVITSRCRSTSHRRASSGGHRSSSHRGSSSSPCSCRHSKKIVRMILRVCLQLYTYFSLGDARQEQVKLQNVFLK